MKQINLPQAKSQLSGIVDHVAKGDSFVITKAGVPVAKLVPFTEAAPKRKIRYGSMAGEIELFGDFDAPLPKWLENAFSGS